MEGYCFRCRAKREMNNATETRMKNGKPAVTGTCATCGTKMFKIGEFKEEQGRTEAPPPQGAQAPLH